MNNEMKEGFQKAQGKLVSLAGLMMFILYIVNKVPIMLNMLCN